MFVRVCSALLGVVLVLAPRLSFAETSSLPEAFDEPPSLYEMLHPQHTSTTSKPAVLSGTPQSVRRVRLNCDPKTQLCLLDGAAASIIYRQIRGCWNPPTKSRISTEFFFRRSGQTPITPKDRGQPMISIAIQFGPDGKLSSRPQADVIRHPSPNAKATANAVISAIERCPLPFDMPPLWRDVVLFMSLEQ